MPPRQAHRRRRFAAGLAAALLVSLTPGLHGQSADEDRPLVWGFTLGAGGTRLTCDICQPSRDLGPSVDVMVGAYASPDLRVGVEAGGWTHDDDGVRETVYRAGVVSHLVPIPSRGLYLAGGFGWTRYVAEDFTYDAPRLSVGAGWDLPFVPGWVIGNQIMLDAASWGSLKNENTTVARRVGLSTLRVSVQVRKR